MLSNMFNNHKFWPNFSLCIFKKWHNHAIFITLNINFNYGSMVYRLCLIQFIDGHHINLNLSTLSLFVHGTTSNISSNKQFFLSPLVSKSRVYER